MSDSPRNLWPYAIVGSFIVFIAAMLAWIVFAVRQNMDLVRPDYYEEELRFQQHIERFHRAKEMRALAPFVYDASAQALVLTLPQSIAGSTRERRRLADSAAPNIHGEIYLYRPSDAGLDRRLPLRIDDQGMQRINTKGMKPGLWKAQLHWSHAGQEYYSDQRVVLN